MRILTSLVMLHCIHQSWHRCESTTNTWFETQMVAALIVPLIIQLNTLHVCLISYMISTGFNYVAALQEKTQIFCCLCHGSITKTDVRLLATGIVSRERENKSGVSGTPNQATAMTQWEQQHPRKTFCSTVFAFFVSANLKIRSPALRVCLFLCNAFSVTVSACVCVPPNLHLHYFTFKYKLLA